jgi:hypothetical protein
LWILEIEGTNAMKQVGGGDKGIKIRREMYERPC